MMKRVARNNVLCVDQAILLKMPYSAFIQELFSDVWLEGILNIHLWFYMSIYNPVIS